MWNKTNCFYNSPKRPPVGIAQEGTFLEGDRLGVYSGRGIFHSHLGIFNMYIDFSTTKNRFMYMG